LGWLRISLWGGERGGPDSVTPEPVSCPVGCGFGGPCPPFTRIEGHLMVGGVLIRQAVGAEGVGPDSRSLQSEGFKLGRLGDSVLTVPEHSAACPSK
jgi:hypothetical protein